MPFLVLVILALAYLQKEWPEPPVWLPLGGVLSTWLGVAGLVLAAGWLVHRFRHQLAQQPERCHALLRRHFTFRRIHLVVLVGFYFVAAYPLGWGWTVKNLLTYGLWTVPGAELLILLPFLTGLFLSWARFYDVEHAIHNFVAAPSVGGDAQASDLAPTFSRWAYVGLQARQCLILAAPPFVLLVLQQILFGLFPDWQKDAVLMPALSGTLLVLLFVGWPWLLRLLLNLKRLPDCPLRQRLEQTARRLSFRCSDILVWDTHDTLASAMLAGPLPILRYVVMTDRLLHNMEPEEVEAVLGHEIGHVKHRHMGFYLVFLVASLLVLSALWDWLFRLLPAEFGDELLQWLPWAEFWSANRELLIAVPMLLTMTVYLFVVFGLVSRRCEQQADLYASRAVAAPPMINALEKVAWLNGMSRERPGWLASWRHGTIAQRVGCLRRAQADPRWEARCLRHIALIKWGLLAGLGSLLVALGPERLLDFFR